MKLTPLPLLLLTLPGLAQSSVIDASNPGQLGASLLGGSQALGAGSASDDFNRPDGTDMGPSWTEVGGDLVLIGNRGAGTSGVSSMTHNGVSLSYVDTVQEIEFYPEVTGAGVIYVAVVAGYSSQSDNIFVKVQDNTGDGIYDIIWFYGGINGGSWGAPQIAFQLAQPIASGRMRVSFSPDGDAAICEIDREMDGVYDELHQATGILASGLNLGTGVGISTYQDAVFDNWNVNGVVVGTAYCFGDGSGGVCPCGNFTTEEAGCANSTGAGAVLSADGDATVGADTLVLQVAQSSPGSPGLFFSGPNASTGLVFGDGLRCVTGQVVRLGVVFSDGAGNAATGFSVSAAEGLTGGELRHYQYWYRDIPGPCGQGFNTSNGLAIQW